jgi:flagellar hook-basal body complex protein FliE
MDITSSKAASAYRDAMRVAEKIVTSANEATPQAQAASSAPMRPNFAELVGSSLDASRDEGYRSEMLSSQAIAREANMHDMILAVSNAELTLNAVVAVRDRVIGAYNDIIKMPI